MPYEDRVRHVARIGVVFGQRSQLWWDLPVLDGFDLLADIYRVEPARYRRRRDELVAMLRLEPLLDQPVRQLSLGQRMRAEFAAALLHDPAILFLDEPTIGLDAPSKLAVRELVAALNREQGVTVLLDDARHARRRGRWPSASSSSARAACCADSPFESLRAGVSPSGGSRRLRRPGARARYAGVTVQARNGRSLELAFDPAQDPGAARSPPSPPSTPSRTSMSTNPPSRK